MQVGALFHLIVFLTKFKESEIRYLLSCFIIYTYTHASSKRKRKDSNKKDCHAKQFEDE